MTIEFSSVLTAQLHVAYYNKTNLTQGNLNCTNLKQMKQNDTHHHRTNTTKAKTTPAH